jgi:hypothetical protein
MQVASQSSSGRLKLDELLSFYEEGPHGDFNANPDRHWVARELDLSDDLRDLRSPREAGQITEGAMMLVGGLVARPDLNGQRGKVGAFNKMRERYAVRFASGETVALRPRSLTLEVEMQPKQRKPQPQPQPQPHKLQPPARASSATKAEETTFTEDFRGGKMCRVCRVETREKCSNCKSSTPKSKKTPYF